ncbi:unnamed protein product, partial [Didymodactylos carnosus]
SSQVFLVYTIINDQRKREIREKRAYSDHSKTSCTAQERQETAVKLSYNYNFHSNQAKIVVDNMTFLSSFVVPFHLAYSPLCASESCQSELKEKCQQRFDAGIGTEILFTFTDDNGRLFTFKAALSSASQQPPPISGSTATTAKSSARKPELEKGIRFISKNPPAEAVPAALPSTTATTNRRWFSAVPLIALCSLGILGLLLVATIVVALIPVYLSKRTVAHQANL